MKNASGAVNQISLFNYTIIMFLKEAFVQNFEMKKETNVNSAQLVTEEQKKIIHS